MSTTNKRILFEGQDVSMSSTMRKLMTTAEEMHRKNLEGVSKEITSSKELQKQLEEEIRQREKSQKLVGRNEMLRIQEEYRERKRMIEALEREEEQRLSKKGLRGRDLEQAMSTYRTEVSERKASVYEDIRSDKEQQLRQQVEEQKTTNDLLRQILDQDTKQWEQEVREDKKNVERFVQQARKSGFDNLSPEQRAKALFQQALLAEGKQNTGKLSVLKDILGAGMIRDFGQILGQMPSARDGLDLVSGGFRMGGGALGGAIGGLARGQRGAVIGAEIGQTILGVAGNAMTRFFAEQEEAQRGRLGVKAVTGFDFGSDTIPGITKFGVSSGEAFNVAREMALRSGSGTNNIFDLIGAETGFGLDRSSLMGFAGTRRRTGRGFGESLSNLLGTAQSGGIDRVLFNELVQNQTQLINSLGNMTEKVDPRNITAVMMEMNRLGGGFSVSDPRSMGFIQSLQGGLTNPNEFGRAMNLSTLRGMSPGASLLDLLEMEEQGLGGASGREFLKGTVSQYNKMFGDEDLTVLALRSRFPGIPIADLRRLARGEDVLGSTDVNQMTQGVDLQGQGNVSMRAQLTAAVKDSFVQGPLDGLIEVQDQFAGYFAKVFSLAASSLSEGVISSVVGRENDPSKK